MNQNFGYSVDIKDDYAVIGSVNDSYDITGQNFMQYSGAVYIFRNFSGYWRQLQKLVAHDRETWDYFGYSVSITNNYVISGAPYEDYDVSGQNLIDLSGSANIFTKENNGYFAWIPQKILLR